MKTNEYKHKIKKKNSDNVNIQPRMRNKNKNLAKSLLLKVSYLLRAIKHIYILHNKCIQEKNILRFTE
jgi:hypothetical protein